MRRLTTVFVIVMVLSLDFTALAQTGTRKPRKEAIGAGGAGTYVRRRRNAVFIGGGATTGAVIGTKRKVAPHRRRRRGR